MEVAVVVVAPDSDFPDCTEMALVGDVVAERQRPRCRWDNERAGKSSPGNFAVESERRNSVAGTAAVVVED